MSQWMKYNIFVAVIAVGSLIFAGCGRDKSFVTEEGEIPTVVVATGAVTKGEIEEIVELTGIVTALHTVTVVPKVGGRIVDTPVAVGDKVNRGDLILRLDAEELAVLLQQAEAGLSSAEAGVAVAEANLSAVRKGARPEELAQASNSLIQAEASYDHAKQNLDRMETLYHAGAISLQQLEVAQIQLTGAEVAFNSAKEAVKMLESGATEENIAIVEAQVRQAAAHVKQAEAQVALARTQFNNTVITAPLAGVVTAVTAELGELAGAGVPLVTILNIDSVEVEINVSERNINQVNKGDRVRVVVSAVGNEPLTGFVTAVNPAVNPQTKQFPVKINLGNSDGLLKAGMFAHVYLTTAREREALVIPKDAVFTVNGQKAVYLVADNKALLKEVALGINDNSLVQVTAGLALGDEVVIKGQHRLEHGQLVLVENKGGR